MCFCTPSDKILQSRQQRLKLGSFGFVIRPTSFGEKSVFCTEMVDTFAPRHLMLTLDFYRVDCPHFESSLSKTQCNRSHFER